MSYNTRPELGTIKPDVKPPLSIEDTTEFALDMINNMENEQINLKITQVVGIDAMYIDGLLTEQECCTLCQSVDNCKGLSFWSANGRENESSRLFRDADTIEIKHPILERKLWNRLQSILHMPNIQIDNEETNDPKWERELPGTWIPTSLNQDFLFAKYPSGGHFAPHTDGRAIQNFNIRSFYSVIIFLNNIPLNQGGGTKFYKDEAIHSLQLLSDHKHWTCSNDLLITEVHPKAGRILIFDQLLVHEGVPPSFPFSKYIIRSDIMYERTPNICSQPHDIEAYKLYCEAQDLAEWGQVDAAIPLFKKSFKLSPELAHFMGN